MKGPKFINPFKKKEKPEDDKIKVNNQLYDEIQDSKIITMDSTQVIALVDEIVEAEYKHSLKKVTKKVVNNTMDILDKMIASAIDNKVKHALRIAKLKIFEDNFREKESVQKPTK